MAEMLERYPLVVSGRFDYNKTPTTATGNVKKLVKPFIILISFQKSITTSNVTISLSPIPLNKN